MVVSDDDSTIKHSSLRIAEYTKHNEDTAHIIYLLNHIYLVWKSVNTVNIITQETIQSLIYIRSTNMKTYVLYKASITSKLV